MKNLIRTLIASCTLILCSCTVNPFVSTTVAGTKIASLGGSVFTKAEAEGGRIQQPDGTILEYTRVKKNETTGVTTSVASWAAGKALEATTNAFRSTQNAKTAAEVTKNQGIQATKQLEINTAAALKREEMALKAAEAVVPK